MSTGRRTAVVICPGRGTYNKDELGCLSRYHPDKTALIQAVDRQVVRDPASLKVLIAAAQKAKRKRILVLVRRGTETKFIAVEGAW